MLMGVLAAALTLGTVPQAYACGHCREDKIAATYDHAVVSAARRNGQTVVFAELCGEIGPASRLGAWIRRQAEASTGVVRGTVRISLEPAALSFVCGPQAVPAALRAIDQKLARRGLGLRLIEAQAASNAGPGSRS
jgi:hypothetical protein